jgi:hypothetical protein
MLGTPNTDISPKVMLAKQKLNSVNENRVEAIKNCYPHKVTSKGFCNRNVPSGGAQMILPRERINPLLFGIVLSPFFEMWFTNFTINFSIVHMSAEHK